MSEYQVIARKWRPQRFSDVVGQATIMDNMKNGGHAGTAEAENAEIYP